jgi:hypothetical protein
LRSEVLDYRLAFPCKLRERLQIIYTLGYLTIEFQAFFKAGSLLKDFAGAILIDPKIGFRNLLLQFIELALPGAGVKETSALPRCVF